MICTYKRLGFRQSGFISSSLWPLFGSAGRGSVALIIHPILLMSVFRSISYLLGNPALPRKHKWQ